MTDKDKNETAQQVDATQQTAEQQPAEQAEQTQQAEQTEQVDLNDQYIRLMAEFDNFKKRTQKEKTQIYVSAAAEVLEAILPFVDNLERAGAVEVQAEEAKTVVDGIRMIERQFRSLLKDLGVSEIEAIGQPFNPELHNAVMHVEDESVEGEGIIIEEFAKGYQYHGKVLRHSTVKVAN